MRTNLGIAVIVALLVALAIFPAPYVARWLAVLSIGILFGVILFNMDVVGVIPRLGRSAQTEVKTDIERTVTLIKKAKTGKVARSLVAEQIAGIYATLSDDYGSTFQSLMNEPNGALKALLSEGDFLDNLERALKIVEDDLNED